LLVLLFVWLTEVFCPVTDSLKIGDYVVFNDVQLGVFLSVEGILLEDIVGIDNVSSLHDCIFCIHLQRQYSASRELNAFLEKYSMDVKNITEESELRYLQALEVKCLFLLPVNMSWR
jgi:hypothetical protein